MDGATRQAAAFDRVRTGIPYLDPLLGGGIPAASVTMIAGEPGAGKTILSLQILFNLAAQGLKCVYYSTLSEPSLKLIKYLQVFSFFDAALVDTGHVSFVDLGSLMRSEGVEVALDSVTERTERDEPDVVVIDSFKAIHDMAADPAKSRGVVYELSVQMASWGATTFLVGEYTDAEIAALPEFAVADGILRLVNGEEALTRVREFEILKLRGTAYVSGKHFFEIFSHGVEFYPRVRTPEEAGQSFDLNDRLTTGVAGLDRMFRGGVPRCSATAVEGGTGTGKTLLGLHFLVEGARRGESGILFTLEETKAQLHALARNFGWDLTSLPALDIQYTPPVELSTDRFLHEVRRKVETSGAKRAVLDSLSSLSLGVHSERRFKELVYTLVKHFRRMGTTPLFTMEVPELLGSGRLTGHGVSSIADNVIRLRYVEIGAELQRAISVLKARGIEHERALRRLRIDAAGVHVEGGFRDLRGVLTGLPVPDSASTPRDV